jgi:hypothetical protein
MLELMDLTLYYYIISMFNDITIKDLNTNKEIFVFVSYYVYYALPLVEEDYFCIKNKLTFIVDPGRTYLNYGFKYIGKDQQINDYNKFFENK